VLVARQSGVLAGAWCALALILSGGLASEALARRRLLGWWRGDAQGAPPPPGLAALALGDPGYEMRRVRRRRERRVAQQRQRSTQFLTAVQASPIGVMLLDAEHRVRWCARVAADHLGLDPQRDIAQSGTHLVRAPAFVEHLLSGTSGQPVIFASANGIRVSVLLQPYGDGLKLVLTQDITEPERAEQMRRSVVANVSHGIRTPLTVLAGCVETMSRLPLDDAERLRMLGLMAAQAQRMRSRVSDLSTLAQLQGSSRPPRLEFHAACAAGTGAPARCHARRQRRRRGCHRRLMRLRDQVRHDGAPPHGQRDPSRR
jgi:two-component system phosphate regulon sensor histidine kinase PhoR